MTRRREFPTKVRVAAFKRADGKCEFCGAVLRPGKYAYDHRIPDGLTGEPTLENCRVICNPCHDVKTVQDVADIARAKRREARHIGAVKPKAKIASRAKSPRIERDRLPCPPPRPLFREISR